MIGSLRILPRTALTVALLFVPLSTASAQDVQDTFREGVDLLSRGQKEAALTAFQRVLALDPSHEDAYALWQTTDHEVWLDMLVMEGEFELVAKRMMDLARMGRKERSDDAGAIRELLSQLGSDDVLERTKVVRQLAAEHGEYAVPRMLFALGDASDADRRVIFMQALTKMGSDVVPPTLEGLNSDDPYMRRNVALTLGYIGDPRANGALAKHATMDDDEGVRNACSEALARTGGSTDALGQLLALGDAYQRQDDSVLAPYQISDVVWNWDGQGVVATPVPRFLYAEEMAKKAYYNALEVAPGSTEALAGIARASMAQRVKLNEREALGEDLGDWGERLAGDELAVQIAGTQAQELALGWSLDQGDQTAAIGLCRALGASSSRSSSALERAVSSMGGAVRGEAAVALGHIASRSGSGASAQVVQALSESVAREVVRIGAVIDPEDARRNALVEALSSQGVLVNAWPTGGRGLASLRAIPGIDVLLVSATLPDLTADQVLDEFQSDPRFADTPVFVISGDEETAALYEDRVSGAIASAADIEAVGEALAGNMNRDREEANRLAADSAHALAALAASGADISAAARGLVSTIAGRGDEIVVPALAALARVGGAADVAPILAVVSDGSRSDEARLAAAKALSGIFARTASAESSTVEGLEAVVQDASAPFEIRASASNALGRLSLDADTRMRLMNAARTSSASE